MDSYHIHKSEEMQGDEMPFSSKRWQWIPDAQNGAYNGTVKFSLAQLYNNSKFVIPSEMTIQIPLVILMNKAVNGVMPNQSYAIGFKNGFHSLIDSVQITMDGKTVVSACKNLPMATSFSMLTRLSQDDVNSLGATLGFQTPTYDSWEYSAVANSRGIGETDNSNAPANVAVAGVSCTGSAYNESFLKRQLVTSASNTKSTALLSANNIKSTQMRSCTELTAGLAGNNTGCQVWYTLATIRLRDIAPLFEQLPVMKGFYGEINLQVNTGSFRCTTDVNGTITMSQNDTQFPNNTCPIMLAKTGGFSNGAVDAYAVSVSIVKPSQNILAVSGVNTSMQHGSLTQYASPWNSCRLYYSTVEMQPALAVKYLEDNRAKYVEFKKYEYNVILNMVAGSTFNNIVSSSVKEPLGLLLIPTISQTANGNLLPATSPFSNVPCLPSPLVSVDQLQVQYGGTSSFEQPVSMTWEFFQQQLYGNGIFGSANGGQELGLNSSLFSEHAFNNYKYYYIDLSRRFADDTSAKQLSISGRNISEVSIDLNCFIISKDSLVVDVSTGKLVA